jgi:hypothetical protein
MLAPLAKYRMGAAAAATLLAVACATPPPGASRGALGVIDNVLSHEGAPPPSPPLVRELLADPRGAMDAAAIFRREAPRGLERLSVQPTNAPGAQSLAHVMEEYLDDLGHAQRALRAALPEHGGIPDSLPAPDGQRGIAAQVNAELLKRAAAVFLAAHARLLRRPVVYPADGARFARRDIVVVVGSTGNDVHAVPSARDGAVRVILEPGGDDRYEGTGIAAGGLHAILDLGGNDRYVSRGAGWGAAIAGVSLLYDAEGDDEYRSGDFGQGAALGGVGVLIDGAGNDAYRLDAFGQGLGLAGGTGVLWDRAGDDRYVARGAADPFGRGGSLSYAQGAAVGVRAGAGGGVGILRDDAGDDAYVAQLYAQGAAYYYGLGLLWDLAGDDRYDAARYAQGAGVHQAIGVLRDERGNDAYALSVGVGQGIGVDLAVGALVDAAGDDRYRAPTLAQGAATANGVGILADQAGDDDWRLGQPPGRGVAEWSRGLPSVGIVLGETPQVGDDARHEAEGVIACPAEPDVAPAGVGLVEALRHFGPELIRDRVAPAGYARLMTELREHPAQSLASLPASDFDVLWPLATALRCALLGASAGQASSMWNAFERVLQEDSASRYAGIIAFVLRARPPPEAQRLRLLARLAAHPSCGVRAAGLRLDGRAASAQAALRSSCWQLQARALRILQTRGVAPESLRRVPPFLRPASARASPRAP